MEQHQLFEFKGMFNPFISEDREFYTPFFDLEIHDRINKRAGITIPKPIRAPQYNEANGISSWPRYWTKERYKNYASGVREDPNPIPGYGTWDDMYGPKTTGWDGGAMLW